MHSKLPPIMKPATRQHACNCFAIRQAARHVTRLYERHLSDAGLTSAQFSILAVLDETGGMTMVELADALVMDRTTLLRAMKPLQRENLLKGRPGTNDPRQLLFSLTAAGERRFKQALPMWNRAQEEFEAEVGSQDAARIREELLGLVKSA
jgi:DNA-binding MarR family transcriptional regulator